MILSCGYRCVVGFRSLHTSCVVNAVNKGLLGKLRKKTGFSINECKKALEQFDNDIEKAEVWMREEAQKKGWAKVSKLQGRKVSQGLIGMMVEKDGAAMIELNCETDFVARNEKFQSLLSKLTSACLTSGTSSDKNKMLLDRKEVNSLSEEGRSLSDLVALQVGDLGENMRLERGAFLKPNSDQHIGSYIHSSGPPALKDTKCRMGKYGSLVLFQQSGDATCSIDEIGRQLSQHIVGMNPVKIGTEDEKASEDKDCETVMIHQEFLLDPDISVKDFLDENGVKVLDFVRFALGESVPEEEAES